MKSPFIFFVIQQMLLSTITAGNVKIGKTEQNKMILTFYLKSKVLVKHDMSRNKCLAVLGRFADSLQWQQFQLTLKPQTSKRVATRFKNC